MELNLKRLRDDTPATTQVCHFNNAGASLPPRQVLDAQIAHLNREAQIGGYEAAAEAGDALRGVYSSLGRLLNGAPDEFALVESATLAWLAAFHAVTRDFGVGDKILTGEAEYAANFVSLLQLQKHKGVEIAIIPSDATGTLDLAALDKMLDSQVKLIAITHVPTNGGLINPAAQVGQRAKALSIPYLLDACQSVGQMPLDVEALGCDFLSGTGRKYLRAPRGTGFLYIRGAWLETLEPAWIDHFGAPWDAALGYRLSAGAKRFEVFESSIAGRLGLGAALDYALDLGLAQIWARIQGLADHLRVALTRIPGCKVMDLGRDRCGIVTFKIKGRTATQVKGLLADNAINVTTPPQTSTPLDSQRRDLTDLVRASVHCYNSEEEIEKMISILGG